MYRTYALIIFLHGFFPFRYNEHKFSTFSDVPEELVVDNHNIKIQDNDNIYLHRHVDRIVVMIIDALRYDFVNTESVSSTLPFLISAIEENQACLFRCKVDTPTVTMPRIKAIVSGSISDFIDVVLNFGSKELAQDNILYQAVQVKKRLVFYGDDTWMKLFPNYFLRSEGTSSFFVNDFKEVDDNVTRNVIREIEQLDWDLMILHYLGLDHIGHVEGPRGKHIPGKLQEMDRIIRHIQSTLEKSNATYLFIISGDHGMKDTGGHGGSSFSEITVPFIVFGVPCVCQKKNTRDILQVDIAPTLSVLLGVPIPYGNIGKIISNIICGMSEEYQLFSLYYNGMQILKNSKIVNSLSTEARRIFSEAKAMHYKWLNGSRSNITFQTVRDTYETSLSSLSSSIISESKTFDTFLLYSAIIILLQIIFLSNAGFQTTTISWIVGAVTIGFSTLCYIVTQLLDLSDGFKFIYTVSSYWLEICTIFLMVYNFLCVGRKWHINATNQLHYEVEFSDLISKLLLIGTFVHILGLFSTSLIEEEHEIWYFLWGTFCVCMMLINNAENTTVALQWFMISCINRFLRDYNRTGIKWVSDPDISDWLENSTWLLSLQCINGLILLYTVCRQIGKKTYINRTKRVTDKILEASCILCIYMYRAAVDDVFFPRSISSVILSKRGYAEFSWFKVLLFTYIMKQCIELVSKVIYHYKHDHATELCADVIRICIKSWVLWCGILVKPYNVFLIGVIVWSSCLMLQSVKKLKNGVFILVLTHHWLSQTFFYYQGNSNNIASIDVTAGFVGQKTYNLLTAGIFIFCNTYCLSVLSYLLLMLHLLSLSNEKSAALKLKFLKWCSGFINLVVTISDIQLLLYMRKINYTKLNKVRDEFLTDQLSNAKEHNDFCKFVQEDDRV